MTLTNKIANCEICIKYAKKIGGKEWCDLFQDAWLDVKEYELKHPDKAAQVTDHKSYFYTALHFRNIRNYNDLRRYAKHINRYLEEKIEHEPDLTDSPSIAYLYEWVNERTDSEIDQFYKNILHLLIVCKTKSEAARAANMSRAKFYTYLEESIKRIKNEFTTTSNNLDGDSITLLLFGDQ